MMHYSMKLVYLSLSLFFMFSVASSESGNKITQEDIRKIIGQWEGTLSYRDYTRDEEYSMPCNLNISEKKVNRILGMAYEYPNEPKANGSGKLKISKSRDYLNGNKIVSRHTNSIGETSIATERMGKDGNDGKKALIKNVYVVSDEIFKMRKEVKFIGSDEWLLRNEFSFERK